MQRGAQIARRLLGTTPSRVMFSNTWGTTVFPVLHLFALALCFSMSRGRPFHVFKLCFSVLANKRPKPFKINALGDFGGA